MRMARSDHTPVRPRTVPLIQEGRKVTHYVTRGAAGSYNARNISDLDDVEKTKLTTFWSASPE